MPEQNVPPAPVRIPQRTSSSLSISSHASAMPTSIGRLSAFFASGRFIVTITVCPCRSTVQCSVPAIDAPLGCRSKKEHVLLRGAWSTTSPISSRPPSTTSASASTSSPTASGGRTPRWRSGPTGSPTTWPRRASAPATTSASTPTTRVEWVETLWAVFKLRAVWVNINYRYVEDELALPLRQRRPEGARPPAGVRARVVEAVRNATCAHVVIEDGSDATSVIDAIDYEDALAAQSPERDFAPRSADDRYILYTGGTTGMPKGVVWRHEDVFFALGGGIDPVDEHAGRAARGAWSRRGRPACPLTLAADRAAHARRHAVGGDGRQLRRATRSCSSPSSTPPTSGGSSSRRRSTSIMITGDAMAPAADRGARRADGADYDLSSLFALGEHGRGVLAVGEGPVLRALPEPHPDRRDRLVGGRRQRLHAGAAGQHRDEGRADRQRRSRDTVVLDEDCKPVEPGSGVIGKVARTRQHPARVLQGPGEDGGDVRRRPTACATSIPGDFATVEADGTHHAARPRLGVDQLGRREDLPRGGRGGGEVAPRRVRRRRRRRARRALGPARRRRRAAARRARRRRSRTIQEHCRTKIAGYKVPRELHIVDQMRALAERQARLPVGQARHRRGHDRRGDSDSAHRPLRQFGIELPIFAFSHCRDVVAAVSKAGGMGVLGALAFSPEQLEIELKWIDEHVDGKPYGVDVVMPASYAGAGDLDPEHMAERARGHDPRRSTSSSSRRCSTSTTCRRSRRRREAGTACSAGPTRAPARRSTSRSRTRSSCSSTRSARRRRTSSTSPTSTA